MNKKFKTLTIHRDCYEKVLFLATRSKQPISTVLDELISNVFQVSMSFETLSLTYELSILSSTCTVKANGKSTFFIGSVSDETEIQKRLGKPKKAKK